MMPVFTDALLGDTLHLSAEEFGAYCLLLFATWRNNGRALAEDDRKMARICRVTPRRWRERLRPALRGFFNTDDGTWHQKRLEKEWQFVSDQAAISRANGLRGGRPSQKRGENDEQIGAENEAIIDSFRSKGGRPNSLNINGSRNLSGSVGITHNEPAQTHTQIDRSPRDLISKPNCLEISAKGKKRKAVFPPDWRPSESGVQFARERGRDDAWIVQESERCREHHISKGNLFANHEAAWRTWVMTAPSFERVNGNGSAARPVRTEAEQWTWHAENYATRRIMLNADEKTSPTDPDGRWFNADMVAAAEAKMRRVGHERH